LNSLKIRYLRRHDIGKLSSIRISAPFLSIVFAYLQISKSLLKTTSIEKSWFFIDIHMRLFYIPLPESDIISSCDLSYFFVSPDCYKRSLIMYQFISVDPSVCTGCKTCEVACSLFHFGECNPARSAIRVIRREKGGLVTSLPLVCQQCDQASCIDACPTGALYRKSEDSPLTIDEASCSACENCVDACPAECISLDHQTNLPIFCDLCGGQPQCVLLCHSNCLTLENNDKTDDPCRIIRLASLMEAEDLKVKSSPGKGGQ